VTHEFLYLTECPIPLLGRDLLTKLRAQITFTQGGPTSLTVRGPNALIMAVTMPTKDKWQLYCQEKGDLEKPCACWRSFLMSGLKKGLPDLVHNRAPVIVELKPEALPVRQRQYPVPQEAHLGIQAHLQWLKDTGY
jgi:hypothetical protein